MFLEFPKMIYGPEGEQVVVDDAEAEAAQLAEWGAQPAQEGEPAVVRRGPGRPRKVVA